MTIKGLLLIAGSLGIGMIAADAASAASPAYCALYSREYAIDSVQAAAAPGMLQSVQDQAYYRCLNMDEDPPLPQKSAYSAPSCPRRRPSRRAPPPPEAPRAPAAPPSTAGPLCRPSRGRLRQRRPRRW